MDPSRNAKWLQCQGAILLITVFGCGAGQVSPSAPTEGGLGDGTHASDAAREGAAVRPGDSGKGGSTSGNPSEASVVDGSGREPSVVDAGCLSECAPVNASDANDARDAAGDVRGADARADVAVEGGSASGQLAAWPGASTVTTVDPAGVYSSNLSGLFYESATPNVLWAVLNSPSMLYRLEFDGTNWVNATTDGWNAGKALVYPSGSGGPDAEGVTRAELTSTNIYVVAEHDNSAGNTSRPGILMFDTAASTTTLKATREWNLTSDLPGLGANLGPEGITWIPDSYLTANAFFDESTNAAYAPTQYQNHGSGIFLVGVEETGVIYAYALDHTAGTAHRLAKIVSGQAAVMDLAFDRDLGNLWAWCDDTCGNRATVLVIDTAAGSPSRGRFVLKHYYKRPSEMPDINNEGIAFEPESACAAGKRAFFWSDDSATNKHSIRVGSIPCGQLP